MRRLMANDVAYGVVLLAFVAAVVAWVYWPRPQRTVVREQTRTGPTLVIQTPPLTPLQARRARRSSAARSPDSATPHRNRASTPSQAPNRTENSVTRPKASTGVPAPKKHKTTSKKPAPAQPPPSPPAQTQPSPPPAVTVPLPSVCTKPIHIGTCP